MPGYVIDHSDGKVHTRYSELKMVTPGQVDRMIAIRLGEMERFHSVHTDFGAERHKMFEEESKRTGRLPKCFYELAGTKDIHVDHVEKEYAVELAPGVVIHSRPDAVCAEIKTIYDFKTTLDGVNGWQKTVSTYRYSKQVIFYAMMLKFHGVEINRAVYLCEVWNADRDKILGYDTVEQEISPEKIEEVYQWALDRIALLKVALREGQKSRQAWSEAAGIGGI